MCSAHGSRIAISCCRTGSNWRCSTLTLCALDERVRIDDILDDSQKTWMLIANASSVVSAVPRSFALSFFRELFIGRRLEYGLDLQVLCFTLVKQQPEDDRSENLLVLGINEQRSRACSTNASI